MHSILAVDDSASMRQMVSFTLKNAGFNVVEAVDGQDAWEKAGQRDFNLVLTDQNMPRMDGREALREIKGDPALRSLPVVVLTTSKAEEDIYRTYDLGVNSFITKPVLFESLVEVMKTLGKYWFEIVELPDGGGAS